MKRMRPGAIAACCPNANGRAGRRRPQLDHDLAAAGPVTDGQRSAGRLGGLPGDVQAQPGRPAAAGAAPDGIAGRRSRGRRRRRSGRRRRRARRAAGPRTRCPPACARTRCPAGRPGRGQVGGRHARPAAARGPGRARTARPWSSASTDQNATRSATTAAASQRPVPLPPRARVLDQRGHRPLQRRRRAAGHPGRVVRVGSDSASSRSAVSGVRSRCDRSATVSRSCADRSLDPAGQLVERRRPPRAPRAGRPGWRGRRGRRRRAGATPRPARRSGGPRCRQPVGDRQAEHEQHQAEHGQDQPGPGHARWSARRR